MWQFMLQHLFILQRGNVSVVAITLPLVLLKFTSESVLSYVNLFPLVEKKRIQRMKRAGKDKPTMETYESLVSYDAFF